MSTEADALILQLRNERKRRGWSQRKIGDALGVHNSEVTEWESGKHEPRLSRVIEWAAVLGMRLHLVDDLMARLRESLDPTPGQVADEDHRAELAEDAARDDYEERQRD